MIAFSSLSSDSVVGHLARLPLRLIPASAVVPILQGPLRGLRWVAHSSTHGCWLGSYELEKQNHFRRCVKAGMVCYDVGANAGFYTLLFSRLVGPSGHVFAFEPVPENCAAINRHLELNAIRNVTLFECALSDSNGIAGFKPGKSNLMGRLDAQGRLQVRTFSLDSIVSNRGLLPPDLIKLDVEGAEFQVLRGARQLLDGGSPMVSVSTHGAALQIQCIQLLRDSGYDVQALDGGTPEITDELWASRSFER